MKPNKLWAITALCTIASMFFADSLSQPYAGKLGVEAVEDAFVDVVKMGYRWGKRNPSNPNEWIDVASSADVDANGWPKADAQFIIDFRPSAEWGGSIDDPDAYRVNRAGVYKGTFTGQADLVWVEGPFTITNKAYSGTTTNTTTFDLTMSAPGPHHGLIIMRFTNTKRLPTDAPGTGISNFRLIRPGYPANTTQVFTNEYISTITSAQFSTIRFMDVMLTNNNVEYNGSATALQSWSNRKKPTDAAQSAIPALNKKDGWSWEYAIALCNQANMSMWINIPVAADDNYITQLARLIRDGGNGFQGLNPGLNIYLEHTNELWNFGFLQYTWNKNRAVQEVGNFNYDGNTDPEIWNQRRHAKRVRDIVNLFGAEFPGQINGRIRGVLAGNSPDPNAGPFIAGRLPGMLQYLNANYGAPKNYIYSISIAHYYNISTASGTANVQQLLAALQADSDAEVSRRVAVVNLANQYQLPGGFCSYEGGPDIGQGTGNLANRIRAVRDPAHKAIFKRNLANNFWDIGGNLAMQFRLQSPYNRYGAWGLTDDINNPDRNSLFQGARELVGGGPPPANNPPVATINTNTTSGNAPLAVNFSATVSDPDGDAITGYAWNFGTAGATSTLAAPSFTYTSATGSPFTATLVVTDSRGAQSAVATKQITVTGGSCSGCPPGYTFIINEWNSFTLSSATDIAYGANGQFNYFTNQSGTKGCNNSTFGPDPIPGTGKACYGKPAGTGDTQAPTVPTGLAFSNVTQTSFTLSWSPSTDNSGTVTGYEVFRDGASMGTTASTSMSVTNLTAGTTYSMRVRARDAVPNWSLQSSPLNVPTTGTTPPTVITFTGLASSGYPGTNIAAANAWTPPISGYVFRTSSNGGLNITAWGNGTNSLYKPDWGSNAVEMQAANGSLFTISSLKVSLGWGYPLNVTVTGYNAANAVVLTQSWTGLNAATTLSITNSNTQVKRLDFTFPGSAGGPAALDDITVTSVGGGGGGSAFATFSGEETENNQTVSVYPNPVNKNIMTINISSDRKAEANISMLSSTLQQVVDLQKTLEKGNNSFQIPIENVRNGVHLLIINKGYERTVKKVMIDR